jgi:HEAT repeat protein
MMGPLAALALSAFAAQDPRSPGRDLVDRLRSDSLEERERAGEELKALGAEAVPELQRASRDADPEVAQNAHRLLAIIDARRKLPPRVVAAIPAIDERFASPDRPSWSALLETAMEHDERGRRRYPSILREDLEAVVLAGLRDPDSVFEGAELSQKAAYHGFRAAIPEIARVVASPHEGLRTGARAALRLLEAREAVPLIVPHLQDSDEAIRCNAVWSLHEIGSAAAVPFVSNLRDDPSPAVRAAAARALGASSSLEALPALLHLLADRDEDVRAAACSELGGLRARESVPPLLAALDDEAPAVQRQAACALGSLGAKEAVPKLIRIMEGPDPWGCCRVGTALSELGPIDMLPRLTRSLRAVLDRDLDIMNHCISAMASRATPEELLRLVGAEDPAIRSRFVQELGSRRASQAVTAIVERLEDGDAQVRRAAVTALGKLGAREAIAELAKRLKDKEGTVQADAAEALGELDALSRVSEICELLASPQALVRKSAVEALGRLGARERAGEIRKFLADENTHVRAVAVHALALLGAREAIPEIIELLGDDIVGWYASQALGTLCAREAVPALAKILDGERGERQHEQAIRALGEIGTPESTREILKRLTSEKEPSRWICAWWLGRRECRDAIPGLLPLLESTLWYDRAYAALALGHLGASDAVDRLLPLLEDGASSVRRDAAVALGELGARGAASAVKRLLEDPEENVRQGAAKALCLLGMQDGVPLLLKQQGPSAFLNVVRSPEAWRRLSRVRIHGIRRVTQRDHFEGIARVGGLALSWEVDPEEVGQEALHRRFLLQIPPGGTRLTHAMELLEPSVCPILESDRLRIVSYKAAAKFWEDWVKGAKAGGAQAR